MQSEKMLFSSAMVFLLTCLWETSRAANIFALLPTASFSHQEFYRVYLLELHKRGHNLTVATPNPIKNSTLFNYREINLEYEYDYMKKILSGAFGTNKFIKMTPELFFLLAWKIVGDVCEMLLSDENLMKIYEDNEKFDLFIAEWGIYYCFHPFSKLADGKIIGIGSYQLGVMSHLAAGNPSNPAYVPDPALDFSHRMNFLQRVRMTVFYWVSTFFMLFLRRKEYEIARKHLGPNIPDLHEIEKNVTIVFDNTHPTTGYPRARNINFIPIGGPAFHLNGRKQMKLPKDIQDFMDNAEHGVIYFSLGTNVKTGSFFEKEEKILMECFSRIKQRVLWKWENENLSVQTENVKISKWFPQIDILAHPNVKAFVMQGGLQSIGEALEYHVPMIIMPFFADQGHNAIKMQSVGVAIVYEFENLEVEGFVKALQDIVNNDTYKKNIIAFSSLIRDQPVSPLENAIWWTEYVLRHNGAPHLRSVAATMPWYQYFMLDVLGTLLLALILFFYVTYMVANTVLKLIFKRRKAKKN